MFQKTFGLLVVLLSCGWSNVVATRFGPEVDTSALANGFLRDSNSVETLVDKFIAFLREKDLASATTMLSGLQTLNMIHDSDLHQKMTDFFMLLKTYATVKSKRTKFSGNAASYPNEFERLLVADNIVAKNVGMDTSEKHATFNAQIIAAIKLLEKKPAIAWAAFSKAPPKMQPVATRCASPKCKVLHQDPAASSTKAAFGSAGRTVTRTGSAQRTRQVR